MSTSYAALVAEIPERLMAQNRSLVDNMPRIITRAVEQIIHVLDHDAFFTMISKDLTAVSEGVIDCSTESPSILELRAVRVARRIVNGVPVSWLPLTKRDLEFLSTLYPDGQQGYPRYYAFWEKPKKYKVFPRPAVDYKIQLSANQRPPMLSDAVQTNVLTNDYQHLLETVCMLEGARFMKSMEDIARLESEFKTALMMANSQVSRTRRDETENRPVETANVEGA